MFLEKYALQIFYAGRKKDTVDICESFSSLRLLIIFPLSLSNVFESKFVESYQFIFSSHSFSFTILCACRRRKDRFFFPFKGICKWLSYSDLDIINMPFIDIVDLALTFKIYLWIQRLRNIVKLIQKKKKNNNTKYILPNSFA